MENNIKRPWICLFSQSGKEILDIISIRGVYPDLIITNTKFPDRIIADYHLDKNLKDRWMYFPNKPTADDYRDIFNCYVNPIITLHGWLRILPAEICEEYEIFNGHPALVNPDNYPELKGFNAQERTAGKKEQYPIIGSVVHRVIAGVDEGEILVTCSRINDTVSIEDAYAKLRETSLETWKIFFEECPPYPDQLLTEKVAILK